MTRVMSRTGMPSVMHTISGMPASAASIAASAAMAAGTKMIEAFAPVFSRASRTGIVDRQAVRPYRPPLPGVTPATTLVPQASISPV